MKAERAIGLHRERAKISNEGSVFKPDIRTKAVVMIRDVMEGGLPPEEEGVQAMKTILADDIARGLSRPGACANFLVENFLDDFMEGFVEKAFDQENLALFIMSYDAAFGFANTLGRIAFAEISSAKRTNEFFDETVNLLTDDQIPSLAEQTETFLSIKDEEKRCASLLEEDPSGIKVLEDFIGRLKNPQDPYIQELLGFTEVPEFATAGAEVALDYFRTLYPLSE
ncbi:MAG: hypothetical protein ACM3IJ_02195 [Candidatus Levyibacteriota bacterium]